LRRLLRKHRHAWIALAVFNFVLFFPTLFMGRVISPNDVFYNFDPWSMNRPPGIHRVQNSLLNDPPTAYLTLMSMLKDAPETFHWNPYIGSGIPGFGSSASAVLTPFVLIPTLLLPLAWVYTGIVFLKFNLAFAFAYWWLREERLGKRGAAAGALVAAGAGVLTVRWLWQLTNAAALYPLLLAFVRRAFSNRRTPVWVMTLALIAYALSGFPAAMAYGAYVVIAYALVLALRLRRLPILRIGEALVATALALLIASPSLVPFIQFVQRTGYLAAREQASFTLFLPPSQWLSFLMPERLGNPAFRSWSGDAALGSLNNYYESTIYLGAIAIVVALFAIFRRRIVGRFFWLAAFVAIVMSMFGLFGLPLLIGKLPGVKYSSLSRLSLVLPVMAAFLAAAGTGWLDSVVRRFNRRAGSVAIAVLIAAIAADLSVFAARYHPYLRIADADVPSTPTIDYLRAQRGPFRIAPTFNYLWPNSSEMFRLEDIRSHFGSEARYRRLLQRIDPSSWAGNSTVIQFNTLNFDSADPAVSMLGVRYLLEHRSIDILKWSVFKATEPGVKQIGSTILPGGLAALRFIRVDAEPFYAIELAASPWKVFAAKPHLEVALMKDGRDVWTRSFSDDDLRVMSKVYVPIRPYARAGEVLVLRMRAVGMHVSMPSGTASAGESPIFYGRVKAPLIFDRELPDGRLFLNLAELPRFHAVATTRAMSDDEMLATKSIDFASEAILTAAKSHTVETFDSQARVELLQYEPAMQRVQVNGSAPMFLASSEKLSPELAITIDGRSARAEEINLVFAGVRVPAGKHEVVFSRRLARGYWGAATAGLLILLGIAAAEITLSRRRG
jgi:hypothetical protein